METMIIMSACETRSLSDAQYEKQRALAGLLDLLREWSHDYPSSRPDLGEIIELWGDGRREDICGVEAMAIYDALRKADESIKGTNEHS